MDKMISSHWFWSKTIGKNRLITGDSINEVNKEVIFSVRIFYILLLTVFVECLYEAENYINIIYDDLLWPVFWVKFIPILPWGFVLLVLSFLITLYAVYKPQIHIVRILSFIFFFLFAAFLNSTGKIGHSYHTLLIPLFCFIFIGFKEKSEYKNFLIFSSAVFALLMSYSLAGFWKVLRGLIHLLENEQGIFSINAMSRLLLYQFRYVAPSAISQWIIENELVGFLLLWSGILIELFALVIFFFKKLHSLWGVLLLLLHISISVIMNINFAHAAIVLLPLLILSPFSKTTDF